MLIKDLVFKNIELPLVQEARVVFSNGHWARILRNVPGFTSKHIDARANEYEAYTSLSKEAQGYLSEIEVNVILAELRYTEVSPKVSNPWDVNA